MMKKIFTIGIIGMFLLTGMMIVSASNIQKSSDGTGYLGTAEQLGKPNLYIKVKTELKFAKLPVEGWKMIVTIGNDGADIPADAAFFVYRSYLERNGVVYSTSTLNSLKDHLPLNNGEEFDVGIILPLRFYDGDPFQKIEEGDILRVVVDPADAIDIEGREGAFDEVSETDNEITQIFPAPKSKTINPIFNNVLTRLLDNHPNMFPLLRQLLGL